MEPAMLPEALFKYAYGEDRPVTVELDNFLSLGEHIPLKESSKLLRKNTPATAPFDGDVVTWQQLAMMQSGAGMMHGGRAPPLQLSSQAFVSPPAPKMLTFGKTQPPAPRMLALGNTNTHRSESGEIRRSDSRGSEVSSRSVHSWSPAIELGASPPQEQGRRTSVSSGSGAHSMHPLLADEFGGGHLPDRANVDGQAAPPPLDHTHVGRLGHVYGIAMPPANDKAHIPTEHYEESAYQALVSRNNKRKAVRAADAADAVLKKPAVAGVVADAGAVAVMKKPAGAAVVIGKPAACVEPCEYKIAWDPAYDKTRAHWVSMHYKTSERRARALGYTVDEARVVARKMHHHAGDVWDANH